MTKFDMCIHHHPCADGFGAAWVVRKALGDIEFVPGQYHKAELPDVKGRRVLLVDFCYKPDVMVSLAWDAKHITVLDHHKSAMEAMSEVTCPANMDLHFDMEHSGAMLAWNYFFPNEEPPTLLRHIEDRDLWRFKLPGTEEIQAAVFSFPYDFEVWDTLMGMPVYRLEQDGIAIWRKHLKDIRELIEVTGRETVIAGHVVPLANLPYTMSSEAGQIMCKGRPFAALYYDTREGRNFSLRSEEGGVDVSEVAVLYGGGGHKHAAGFRVPFSHPLVTKNMG